MYVHVRALPVDGFTYRWGAGRAFTKEVVTLEVVPLEVAEVKLPGADVDLGKRVQELLANERAVEEFHRQLSPTQISTKQLADIKTDERLVVVENVAAPPPPPKSEAETLRERVALLEKQIAKKA